MNILTDYILDYYDACHDPFIIFLGIIGLLFLYITLPHWIATLFFLIHCIIFVTGYLLSKHHEKNGTYY